MNFIKILTAFVIIFALTSRGECKRREKRTLSTILQFLGYQLVPIATNNEQQRQPEKIRSEPMQNQNQRMPKLNRIQTVMPFVEVFEMATQANDMLMTSTSEMPVATTETPMTESTSEVQIETSTMRVPLRIIMEDPIEATTESTTAAPSSTSEIPQNSSTTTEATLIEQTTSPEMSARLEESTPLPNIASLPLGSSHLQSFEAQQSLVPPGLKSFVKVDLATNPEDQNLQSIEQKFGPIDQNLGATDQESYHSNNNVEVLRSDDVSGAFFDQQSFPVYESFPSFSGSPPQPFALAHETSYLPQQPFEQPQVEYGASTDYSPARSDYAPISTHGDYFDYRTYYQ